MTFEYYKRLSAAQKRTYDLSDEIKAVVLPDPGALRPIVPAIGQALEEESPKAVEMHCRELLHGLTGQLGAPPLRISVLSARPHNDWGELHGLYLPAEGRRRALIQLWMRTAKQGRVVAFRSFLRTLLHELCHHLDYEVFLFPETFHTEGFYKRESSLFHQLMPEKRPPPLNKRARSR